VNVAPKLITWALPRLIVIGTTAGCPAWPLTLPALSVFCASAWLVKAANPKPATAAHNDRFLNPVAVMDPPPEPGHDTIVLDYRIAASCFCLAGCAGPRGASREGKHMSTKKGGRRATPFFVLDDLLR
jgi:hypothetical protein